MFFLKFELIGNSIYYFVLCACVFCFDVSAPCIFLVSKEGVKALGTGVIDYCGPQHMGAGN